MSVIKATCIHDLKLRINIVDVVSRVATLRKAGSRFKGLCPFHQEKTPSFHVDPDKGFYKCFGCGKSGDIFTFVRETEQLSFTEAVEALGQRFSIPIEYDEGKGPSREERSLRQEIFEIHELAADFFHQALRAKSATGDFMRAYWLEKRRFSMEIADEFRIGAAAPVDDGLAAMLLKRRFSEESLRQCGLLFVRDDSMMTLGSIRTRFRGRLMIPIRDHQGRVVAFTARQTDLTPTDDASHDAKYVNSPETPIFSKSHLLFNLDRARTAAGDGHPFVLVEGQLDAIRCWSVGLKTAVAPQGTSITEQQLVLLRRYHQQVECFFDSDSAGQKAALRFLPMALKAGLEARFLTLTGQEKNDPDLLFLEHGLAAYEQVRASALSAMAFACRAHLPVPESATPEQKSRTAQTLFEIIAASESEVTRAGFIQEVSHFLQLPHSALSRDFDVFRHRLSRQSSQAAQSQASTTPPSQSGTAAKDSPEQHLLLLLLHHERLGKALSSTIPHQWIDTSHTPGLLLHRFLNEVEHDNWPGRDSLEELLHDTDERALIASLLFDPPSFEDPLKIAAEGIKLMRTRALEPRLRKIELDLANLRKDSTVDAISLIKERTELQRQLRQPIGLSAAD
ncbi:MAG: DNA primase [Opitutaceae bacterium]|jgi:DNA primase